MELRIKSFKEMVEPSEDLVGKKAKVVSGFFQGLEGKVVGINPSDNGIRIENKDGDVSTISPENVELVESKSMKKEAKIGHNGVESASLGNAIEVYANERYGNYKEVITQLSCWSGNCEYKKDIPENILTSTEGDAEARYDALSDFNQAEQQAIYSELSSIVDELDSKIENMMRSHGYTKI